MNSKRTIITTYITTTIYANIIYWCKLMFPFFYKYHDIITFVFETRPPCTFAVSIFISDKQTALNQFVVEGSSVFVKLCYSGLFLIVVIILLIVTQKALYSPWGRMMRAIRDNEEAANAMGKNVVKQHLLIFILGSAIVGIAGAMLVTQDGLFTPGSYRPMRYTFLIWVMVIVGGSGNNFGAILGGFAVWFLWIEAAPIALFLINLFTSGMSDTHALKIHLIESVPYFRYLMMGLGLLLIMRYRPKGILPEKIEIK